jgi:hypothetical protein
MLSRKQMMALSAARSAFHRKGLTKTGSKWQDLESPVPESHHHRTIMPLVDRELLKLWVNGTCAHITELGMERLRDYNGPNGV